MSLITIREENTDVQRVHSSSTGIFSSRTHLRFRYLKRILYVYFVGLLLTTAINYFNYVVLIRHGLLCKLILYNVNNAYNRILVKLRKTASLKILNAATQQTITSRFLVLF